MNDECAIAYWKYVFFSAGIEWMEYHRCIVSVDYLMLLCLVLSVFVWLWFSMLYFISFFNETEARNEMKDHQNSLAVFFFLAFHQMFLLSLFFVVFEVNAPDEANTSPTRNNSNNLSSFLFVFTILFVTCTQWPCSSFWKSFLENCFFPFHFYFSVSCSFSFCHFNWPHITFNIFFFFVAVALTQSASNRWIICSLHVTSLRHIVLIVARALSRSAVSMRSSKAQFFSLFPLTFNYIVLNFLMIK